MNRQDWLNKAKELASDARVAAGVFVDAVKAHPYISAAVGFVLLGFVLGAYVFAGTATINCAGGAPAWDAATSTLTCPASAGGGTPAPTPTPTPTPTPQPSPYAGCPAGTIVIKNQWGNTTIVTSDYGDFGGNIVVVEVKVPATGFSGTKTSSWAEYQSGGTSRYASFSTKPCDFSRTNALVNGYQQAALKAGVGFNFQYRVGTANGFTLGVVAGQTYYLNIKNADSNGNGNTCTIDNCSMRGGLPQ
jgi:hypothetical protein